MDKLDKLDKSAREENFKKVFDVINTKQNIVITTHIVPDGDAIGSVISMYLFLKQKGKNPVVINHSPTPSKFKFLDNGVIRVFEENKEENEAIINNCDLILVMDTNEYSRTKSLENILRSSSATKICIDHHMGINPADYDAMISMPQYPANCQLLYDFYTTIDENSIDEQMAACMYLGIMTDTGSFRFPRTDENTLMAAANLIKRGANPVELYDIVYGQTSLKKLKLISRFVQGFEFYNEGRFCLAYVTRKDFEELGLTEEDMEGLSGFTMDIEKVRAAVVITELKTGLKFSFRSKGNIPMNLFAKEFGGGGHVNASGARDYELTLEQAKQKVLSLKDKYIP